MVASKAEELYASTRELVAAARQYRDRMCNRQKGLGRDVQGIKVALKENGRLSSKSIPLN